MGDKLLIDTNLLLLMIIGSVDGGRYIEKSKRLGDYCLEDFDRLITLAGGYKEVWITPYIAAEVSNLIDLTHHARVKAFEIARELFAQFKQFDTLVVDDSESSFFITFGITNSSIIKLSEACDIVTTDMRMLEILYAVSPDRIIPYPLVKSRNKRSTW